MLSIITCSRRPVPNESLVNNLKNTVGLEYELISIDNSKNEYSIFSAYNKGIDLSKYEHLCFIHDDVDFKTQDWGQKVVKHLQIPDSGIFGVAGGDIMSRVPNDWATLNPCAYMIYGQTATQDEEMVVFPNDYNQSTKSVLMLDGVFLFARKELFKTISFDESFNGFHGYDYDISLQSHVAGYTNYVIYDILLEHYSRGVMGHSYFSAQLKLHQKWGKYLPLFNRSFDQRGIDTILPKIELDAFDIFYKRLVRSKIAISDIHTMVRFYASKAGLKSVLKNVFCLYISVFFLRLSSIMRGKMIE